MNKKVKVLISLGILILLAIGFYVTSYVITKYTGYTITGKAVYKRDEQIQIAQCLSNKKVVLYCSGLSLNCMRQRKTLGDGFEYLNYVNCDDAKNVDDCKDLNLPAWKIGDRFYFGIRDYDKLVDSSGCQVR